MAEGTAESTGCARAGVGCFSLFIGTISGAMVGALVSKYVAFFARAPECEGVPACDWHVYAGSGALVGAVTLFVLVMWRLRRRARRDGGMHATTGQSDRG